jgi:hypothetical protein
VQAHELFEILANKTWRSIGRCGKNKIHLGEDALTTINLDAIASARFTRVLVEDTRAQESKKGCDFELWLGNQINGWRRYAVQAKKIQLSDERYAALTHRVNGKLQIDILEEYSNANHAIPIYALYSNSDEPYNWHCSLPNERGQLGIGIVSALDIRSAINTFGHKSFFALHNFYTVFPWRCLIRCENNDCNQSPKPWDSKKNKVYDRLPTELHSLHEKGETDLSVLQGKLFSEEFDLRPEWIAVIDTSKGW